MRQISFASAEQQGKKRVTRREKFLGEMEQVVPWSRLLAALEPHYPKGTRGRPPIGLERMLRLYYVQQWYALSDEGLEDAVSDSAAIRQFVGIDLGHEEAPDATTVLKFRRLLEAHKLTAVLLEEINAHLRERGLTMREGTMVDATLINAPTSTKNRDKARDPEMPDISEIALCRPSSHRFCIRALAHSHRTPIPARHLPTRDVRAQAMTQARW